MATEDLNDKSHEPATRGDVRNLALRLELRIVKSESKLIEQMNTTGWKFFAATMAPWEQCSPFLQC